MNQAAGTDDFLNTTIVEGLTDDVCPVYKALAEVAVFHAKIQSDAFQDLLLNCRGRIGLLKGHRETLKERFVEHVGADEATIIRTLTFGVGGGNHIETSGRFHKTTDFLQEDTLTFQDRLEAQDLVGSKVNLIGNLLKTKSPLLPLRI